MKPFRVVALVAGLLVATACGADEPVEFKTTLPKKDTKVKVTINETIKTELKVSLKGKEPVESKSEVKSHFEYTEDTEEVMGERVVKLKRQYENVTLTTSSGKEHPLQGKTVQIEKKNKGYEFKEIGGSFELTAKEKELLDAEFNKGDKDLRKRLFPSKPVKSGDTWPIAGGEWVKALGTPEVVVSANEFMGKGKAIKTENRAKKDNKGKATETDKPYAEIEVDLDVRVTGMHFGDKPDPATALKAEKGSKLTARVESKGMTDGSLPQDTTVTLTLDVTGVWEGCDVKLKVITTEARKLEKK